MSRREIDQFSQESIEAERGLFDAVKLVVAEELRDSGILEKAERSQEERRERMSRIMRGTRSGKFNHTSDRTVTHELIDVGVVMVALVQHTHSEEDIIEVPALELTTRKTLRSGKEVVKKEQVVLEEVDRYGHLFPSSGFTDEDVDVVDGVADMLFELKQFGLLSGLSEDLSHIEG